MTDTSRLSAMVLALSLVASACSSGGGDDEADQAEEQRPGVTVTSDDGVLSVFVPDGAGPTELTIEKLDALPEAAVAGSGLADAVADPEGGLTSLGAYALGPDGATFDEPVTVAWRTDFETDGSELPPAAALITTPAGDGVEGLDDVTVMAADGVAVVSGTTTHFSGVEALAWTNQKRIATANNKTQFTNSLVFLRPKSIRQQVGQSTAVKVDFTTDADRRVTFEKDVVFYVDGANSGKLEISASRGVRAEVGCKARGKGRYFVDVHYTVDFRLSPDGEKIENDSVFASGVARNLSLLLAGEVECTEATGGGGGKSAVAAGQPDTLTLPVDCFDDANAPCSEATWHHIAPRVGLSFDPPPPGGVTLSMRFLSAPAIPGAEGLECRAFADIADCVAFDANGTPVGEPGPDIVADLAAPSIEVDYKEVATWFKSLAGGPLRSLTPVEVSYSTADGKIGGGTFGEAARRKGKAWFDAILR